MKGVCLKIKLLKVSYLSRVIPECHSYEKVRLTEPLTTKKSRKKILFIETCLFFHKLSINHDAGIFLYACVRKCVCLQNGAWEKINHRIYHLIIEFPFIIMLSAQTHWKIFFNRIFMTRKTLPFRLSIPNFHQMLTMPFAHLREKNHITTHPFYKII